MKLKSIKLKSIKLNYKKIICMFLTVAMVTGLAACGAKMEETPQDQNISNKKASETTSEITSEITSETTAGGITQTEAVTTEAAEKMEKASAWYELSEDGKVLTVQLDSNPTTGYQWSYVIEDPKGLELISEEYVSDETDEILCGVGGTWTASFKSAYSSEKGNAEKEDSNSISLIYSREWEGESLPEKVIDLYISGSEMRVIGVHEPKILSADQADDGEYEVTLNFYDMIKENGHSCYALAGIPKVLTWTDEEVKALKVGDVLPLSKYGIYDITVERIEKRSDDSIAISDSEYFAYDNDKKAWVLYDWDDTIYKYNTEKRLVHFSDETLIEDEMQQLMDTEITGTIYERMSNYLFADCSIIVENGEVSSILIHYHS